MKGEMQDGPEQLPPALQVVVLHCHVGRLAIGLFKVVAGSFGIWEVLSGAVIPWQRAYTPEHIRWGRKYFQKLLTPVEIYHEKEIHGTDGADQNADRCAGCCRLAWVA
jgi:hypothetical protein